MLRILITTALIVVSLPSLSPGQGSPAGSRTENTIGIVDGRITVQTPGRFSIRARTKSSDEEYGRGIGACAGRGEWKCVVGGAALGFVAGALIGHSLGPKPVEHPVSGYGIFGYYSNMHCDAHCDDQDKYVAPVGIGGALIGGVFGHYVAKWSSQ